MQTERTVTGNNPAILTPLSTSQSYSDCCLPEASSQS